MNGHLQPNLVDLCAATAGLDDKVLPISQHKEMHLSCFLAVINSLLTSGGKILILPKKIAWLHRKHRGNSGIFSSTAGPTCDEVGHGENFLTQ